MPTKNKIHNTKIPNTHNQNPQPKPTTKNPQPKTHKTMNLVERFVNYTKFDTQSSEDSQTVPSTSKQLIFAKYLKEELEREGLADVEMDENGYIYATLKSNSKKNIPTIGFISHYDTSPDCSGANVNP